MASRPEFHHLFKLILIGDSRFGKSSLLFPFISHKIDDVFPTIGVDFKLNLMMLKAKKEAQGLIPLYDVTRHDTFTNLSDIRLKEVEMLSTNPDRIKMLMGKNAKTRLNVEKCLEELVLKTILDTPSLLYDTIYTRKNILHRRLQSENSQESNSCC
ncbi:hypothetical protein KP509_10G085200 [Ceratopteris richardii]|uniref:Uncharacterized protein n=1 Tax=Ceratopteris richardii TaxID=49495 RepID=A0A8T2TX25_CERRI|nr:hypothetical protein KP509_10G085200 [Ceratopteris richardii]